MVEDKAAENRLRRAAARQGLRLEKARQRDPLGLLYNTWRIVDAATGEMYAAGEAGPHTGGYGLTLAQVQSILSQGRR